MANKYNSTFAKIVGFINRNPRYAVTVGQTAYYSVPKSGVNQYWRCHEDRHKYQYAQHGVAKFLWLYLIYSIRYGYHNNPFELDAEAHANDYLTVPNYRHLPD